MNNNPSPILYSELMNAYFEAARHKHKTVDVHNFEMELEENIRRLALAIEYREYEPGRSLTFVSHKPVDREIFAAQFSDRVAQHLLIDYVDGSNFVTNQFITDSYSCIKGRGTDYAIKRLYHHAASASSNFKNDAFVFKGDLKQYFTSLPRKKILRSALVMLKKQKKQNRITDRRYEIAKFLWTKILLDDPCKKAYKRGKHWEWEALPFGKSLYHQPPGYGIAIGNITSQYISNIYLNDFDQFVTKMLGFKRYGRYVDDFYIIVPMDEKEKLLQTIPVLEKYLADMELTLHPNKRYTQVFSNGIPFLGVKIAPYRIVPDKRIIKNFRAATKHIACSDEVTESDWAGLVSYLGRLKGYNARRLEKQVFESLGWDYDMPNYDLMAYGHKRKPDTEITTTSNKTKRN